MKDNIWTGLLPKRETEALDFIENHPNWDGRGVIVGILDTGVDPGAIGLQTTSDGKPKILDIIDCSGSGDVLMGPLISPNKDGYLPTSGGRMLKINPTWKNPSNQYRVGIKRAYELFPKELKSRLSNKVREDQEKIFRDIENKMQNHLLNTKSGEIYDDAKMRLQYLKLYEKDYEDTGPIYDCLVFFDGKYWQAAIDTTETGNFETATVMTDYHILRQYSTFPNSDHLNYSIHIYDNGTILSIVIDTGAHGSHVAGIVSAYHPDMPECNGVAPGAQIISLKIGDSRLGSMETAVGLMRALIEAVKKGCHIINMSYGEATSWCNTGAFNKLTDEIVKKYGIIFVSSAGNNGPALSTVGCPGGTSTACIGVGAYVTHSLMSTAYSMLQNLPETNYTWSSMGPTLEGEMGVSIIAPGAAVTSVPNWTLNKKQLMNGTSMSSPNACGCLTLLLSAALANDMKYSPISMRRAIENSAKFLENVHPLGQGYGLVQVEQAWCLLQHLHLYSYHHIGYKIKVNHPNFNAGIYLRQPHESVTANTFQVMIEPEFHETTTPEMKIDFEVRVTLESSASWIQVPNNVIMLPIGKNISVYIDPRELPVGEHVHYIRGYDSTQPRTIGHIFQIPVTVIKPEPVLEGTTCLELGRMTLEPGQRIRKFIVPPRGCTYIDCRITDPRQPTRNLPQIGGKGDKHIELVDEEIVNVTESPTGAIVNNTYIQSNEYNDNIGNTDDSSRMIVLHAVQLLRGVPYRDYEEHTYKTLTPGSEHTLSWSVFDDVTMELVIGRTWGCIGDTACDVTLYFRGINPVPQEITMTGGQRVSKPIRIFSSLTSTDISPLGKLDKWINTLKPISAKILPLGERDILPDLRPVYQLLLEYEIDLLDPYDIICRWLGLQGILYESQFMGQFFMIYNWKKHLIGVGDAWPKPIKLSKGKYTIRLQVRHVSSSILETLIDMPVQIERPIKNQIPLSFYMSQTDALVGNGDNKCTTKSIPVGSSLGLFLKEPTQDSLPKACLPGDVLVGLVTFIKKGAYSFGSTDRPNGYYVKYIVADTKPKPTPATTTTAVSASTANTTTTTAATTSVTATVAVTANNTLNSTTSTTNLNILGNSSEDSTSTDSSIIVNPPTVPPTLTTAETDYLNNIKEQKIKYLKTLIGQDIAFMTIYGILHTEYPQDLIIEYTLLTHYERLFSTEWNTYIKLKEKNNCTNNTSKSDEIKSIIKCIEIISNLHTHAVIVVSLINQDQIALELGKNVDKESSTAVQYRKEMESKKTTLCDSYHIQGKALLCWLQLLTRYEDLIQLGPILSIETTVPAAETIVQAVQTSEEKTSTVQAITEGFDHKIKSLQIQYLDTRSMSNVTIEYPIFQSASTSVQILDMKYTNKTQISEDFTRIYKELLKWDDVSTDKYAILQIGRYKLLKYYGLAIKRIHDSMSVNESKMTPVLREMMYMDRDECWKELGMSLAIDLAKKQRLLHLKDSYEAF